MKKRRFFNLSELILLYLAASSMCGTPIIFDLPGDLSSKYGFSKSAVYKMSSRLKKKGLIEAGSAGFRITLAGLERLQKGFDTKARGPWDGKWRVVVFDIPEKLRKIRGAIRTHLKSLGMGRLQQSVWVSAYDIRWEVDLLAKQFNLTNNIHWFESSVVGDAKDFAYRCWDLLSVNNKYRELVKAGKKLNKVISIKDFIKYKEWEKKYFKLLEEDPQLPAVLLPPDWQGNLAGSLYHSLKSFYKI
jgi:phenylacetic acid degradation operon negative regulatory protein